MARRVLALLATSLSLAACASDFDKQRTVFHNPLNPFPLGAGPADPAQCGDHVGQYGCWFDGIFYPGVGRYAFARDGSRIELSRNERRTLRERTRNIRAQAELNRRVAEFNRRNQTPASPQPGAPATANGDKPYSPPASGSPPSPREPSRGDGSPRR